MFLLERPWNVEQEDRVHFFMVSALTGEVDFDAQLQTGQEGRSRSHDIRRTRWYGQGENEHRRITSQRMRPDAFLCTPFQFSNVESARQDLNKSKEQLEEEKRISLSFRIQPLNIDNLSQFSLNSSLIYTVTCEPLQF